MSRRTGRPAKTGDIQAVVKLVNSAYRGDEAKKGWTTEADLLGGQRIDSERVQELLGDSQQQILVWDSIDRAGELDSCVLLERKGELGYLGMLTVRPDLQNAGLGRLMLEAAEDYFKKNGQTRIEMTVIRGRNELIAWYERRGYTVTNETRAFPMTNPRFGIPKTNHLEFVVLEKSLVLNTLR